MSDKKKLQVVFCWHMHQPEYRDLQTGEYKLPWTYLHVIKDYVDMVAHLEAHPEAKAVVNFAPILLEQIEDYAKQINNYLHDRVTVSDPLLAALVAPAIPSDPDERLVIVKNCLRANRERLIDRYPPFRKLAEMVGWLEDNHDAMQYINSQFIADILVWYHLAWMGETVKLTDPRVKRLIEKGCHYTLQERFEIIEIIGDIFSKLICRYRNLAKNGRIELSVTPYAHPIMPLMLDINSTHQAMPDAPLPELEAYPGGEERVKWHLKQGLATFERFFGFKPRGCWPSEGSVSKQTLKLLSEFGFDWTASGGSVLHNSLRHSQMEDEIIHQPFTVKDTKIAGFFRDDGLSDLVGFEYSTWHAEDAVADLVQHLQNIAEHESEASVVSIILDGENAWEHYPNNGFHFLNELYKNLSQHPDIELTTFSECLDAGVRVKELPELIAGSWVYGTFSTWIGDTDKNRGWDMLGEVKQCFDKVVASGRLSKKKLQIAENQLAICEGSDWFWWFGDYNPGEAVSNFEKQFRLNLSNLYQLLGEEAPAYLSLTFTQGSGDPAMGGAMRPGAFDNA
jgi:alpha-amylase/alpha-mannosidase (GH57 family)